MKTSKVYMVLIWTGLSFLLSSCEYVRLRSIGRDLAKQHCESAKNKTLSALKNTKYPERYHYNLIHVFLCEEKVDLALKQTDYVLSLSDSPYRFPALFLKGYLLGQIGDVDLALDSYQQALQYQGDIKIKQNMELLLQQNQGKSKKKDKDGKQQDSEKPDESKKDEDKKDQSANQTEHDEKQQQEESQKQKNLSEKQVQQIMKEIDNDEKRVRSQGIDIKKGKGQKSDKNW